MDHYPIKRRRQPRRLNPNWDGVDWLEAEAFVETEISELTGENDGLTFTRALGWYSAKRNGNYARPMFQIFADGLTSTSNVIYDDPCPTCDDFSRSWRCSNHPDEGTEGLKNASGRRQARVELHSPSGRRSGLRFFETITPDPASPIPGRREFLSAPPGYISVDAARPRVDFGPTREDWLNSLGAATIEVSGFFSLEVNGETVQGAGPLSIEVEPHDR